MQVVLPVEKLLHAADEGRVQAVNVRLGEWVSEGVIERVSDVCVSLLANMYH